MLAQIVWWVAKVKTPVGVPAVDVTNTTIVNVFNSVLGLAGALAVVFVVYGGIQYSLSQGDPAKVKQAKDTILYSVIGLVVVMVSFAIINLVIGGVGGA